MPPPHLQAHAIHRHHLAQLHACHTQPHAGHQPAAARSSLLPPPNSS
jgi:hypothetical protein